MRTMLKISMPVEPANKAIKDGSLAQDAQSIIDELRPEQLLLRGERQAHRPPRIRPKGARAEFPSVVEADCSLSLNAGIELYPVMNAQDMKTGVEKAIRNAGRCPSRPKFGTVLLRLAALLRLGCGRRHPPHPGDVPAASPFPRPAAAPSGIACAAAQRRLDMAHRRRRD